MNYNDISQRLKRTLSSLNARFDDDITKHINVRRELTEESWSVSMTVGDDDEPTMFNKIFTILYNLASLKDHLKNCFTKQGINPKIVEQEIDNSLHLQVLIDIVNQEKHGYPLTKSNRSGKNPLISSPWQALTLSVTEPGEVASISFDLNGELNISGSSKVQIVATITDGQNNVLFSLDELVESCYEKWENLAKSYLPPPLLSVD